MLTIPKLTHKRIKESFRRAIRANAKAPDTHAALLRGRRAIQRSPDQTTAILATLDIMLGVRQRA